MRCCRSALKTQPTGRTDVLYGTPEFVESTRPRHNKTKHTSTMLQPQEESEAEVRRVDQDNINKFARLNARLHELRDERDLIKVCSFHIILIILPVFYWENLTHMLFHFYMILEIIGTIG